MDKVRYSVLPGRGTSLHDRAIMRSETVSRVYLRRICLQRTEVSSALQVMCCINQRFTYRGAAWGPLEVQGSSRGRLATPRLHTFHGPSSLTLSFTTLLSPFP